MNRQVLMTAIFCCLAVVSPAWSADYDIVILDGRVMDPETGFDAIRNVGIKGNRIAVITETDIEGDKVIEATGLAVVPGFINTHSHSFAPFDQKMMAYDGTTTLLITEDGVSNAHLFYERYEDKSLLNFGSGISHESVRRVVLDGLTQERTSDPTSILIERGLAQEDGRAQWALDVATPEEHRQILTMFEQGMRDGAICVTSTVDYMGYAVPTYEIFDLQKLAKKYDRFYGSHTRFGPTESLPLNYTLGVREVIANAVAIDGALILSHIQNQNWQESYELTRRLQEKGMKIFAEYYPAITGNPNIATPQLLPDKIKSNNIDPTKHIYNPDTGELFESEESFFKMQAEQPEKAIFIIVRNPAWMDQWPYMKDIAIANDSIAYRTPDGKLLPVDADSSEYGGHPRNAGTGGWALRQAREKNIPLMDMVNNLSYIPAKYFSMVGLKAMQERGRMQPGMIADITIFDPDTVTDTATMKQGERGSFTKGIPYVLVNGSVVIDMGEADLALRPGQPIRYAPITKGEIVLDYDDAKYQWDADLKDRKGGLSPRDWVSQTP